MTGSPYHFEAGTAPPVIPIPHLGRDLPDAQRAGMTPQALRLPDLNIGTAQGRSCGAAVTRAVEGILRDCPYTWTVDGRFKGGHITLTYGDPGRGVHAVQLETCLSTYMNERHPCEYREGLVGEIKPVVRSTIVAALDALHRADRQ